MEEGKQPWKILLDQSLQKVMWPRWDLNMLHSDLQSQTPLTMEWSQAVEYFNAFLEHDHFILTISVIIQFNLQQGFILLPYSKTTVDGSI